MAKIKKLIIFDLDNTLIYGSSEADLSAKILFRYSEAIFIYERPFAIELIQRCHEIGDVIVYTTAGKDYAEKLSNI